jgi:hypothetical protein
MFLIKTMKQKIKQRNTPDDEKKNQQNNNQRLSNPTDGMTMGMGVEDGQYLFSKPSQPTGWWEGSSRERWGLTLTLLGSSGGDGMGRRT